MAHNIDTKALMSTLEPAPSLSRMGRCAYTLMHTGPILRATNTAFASPNKKAEPRHAEIVDEESLGNFGTAPPALDAGRNKELCSSPRDHPIFQAKEELSNAARQRQAFQQMLSGEQQPRGATLEAPKAGSPAPLARVASSIPTSPQKGSPCFRSAIPRLPAPETSDIPPVGHYRPRYSVVDRSVLIHSLGGPRLPSSPLSPAQRSLASGSPAGTPTSLRKTVGDLSSPVSADTEDIASPKEEEEVAAVLPSPEDESQQKSPKRPQGTSPFLSTTKPAADRPPDPLRSPDKFYWPYNEVATSPKFAKGALVEFGKQFKPKVEFNNGHAPDVFYNPKMKETRDMSAHDMAKHIDREPARQLVATHHSRRGIAPDAQCQALQDNAVYKPNEAATTKFRRSNMAPKFVKTSGRDRKVGIWPLVHEEPPGPALQPQQSFKSLLPHMTSPDFNKQTVRKGVPNFPLNDLEYEPNYPVVEPQAPSPKFRTAARTMEWLTPKDTLNLDYSPNHRFVEPRTDRTTNLEKQTERQPERVQLLDQFYDTDTPLTEPHVKGDPMLSKHQSRDARAQQHALPPPLDTMYDYNVAVAQQRTIMPGQLEFDKFCSREDALRGSRIAV